MWPEGSLGPMDTERVSHEAVPAGHLVVVGLDKAVINRVDVP